MNAQPCRFHSPYFFRLEEERLEHRQRCRRMTHTSEAELGAMTEAERDAFLRDAYRYYYVECHGGPIWIQHVAHAHIHPTAQ